MCRLKVDSILLSDKPITNFLKSCNYTPAHAWPEAKSVAETTEIVQVNLFI